MPRDGLGSQRACLWEGSEVTCVSCVCLSLMGPGGKVAKWIKEFLWVFR